MKKLFLLSCVLAFSTGAFSQKIYFAYLQSENSQPFFVRMHDKVYSSTASGYLILSRLLDSTYTIYLGFPGQAANEQKFTIPVNHKDRGYLLKDFGEKGWGLFDLQSLQVQMSANAAARANTTADPNISPFTEILSKAADDPSLKEKPVVPEPEKKEVAVIPAVQKEEMATVPARNEDISVPASEPVTEKIIPPNIRQAGEQQQQKNEEEKNKVVASEKPDPAGVEKSSVYKASRVTLQAEASNPEGHDMVFVDKPEEGRADTIRLLIPAQKPVVAPVAQEIKEEKKFLDITAEAGGQKEKETIVPETKADPVTPAAVKPTVETPASSSQPARVACKKVAEEADFLRLRRKMVAADNDDDMVMEARKYFKTSCFTVYQIRNLGNLFLSDEGKYKLYDAAYPHVSDAHNFISLKLELKEGYWVKRFEAMLK